MTQGRRLLVLGAAMALLAAQVKAQDAHYWSQHYGTRSKLLRGSVVGSLLDLSATYYNPGALALLVDPSNVQTGFAFEQQRLKVEIGSGGGGGLSETRFSTAPSLFTTLIPLFEDGGDRLAFSVLNRATFEARLNARESGTGDVLENPSGIERFATEILLDQRMNETWVGVTWARQIEPRVGIGVTPYLAYRSQRTRLELTAAAEGDTSGVATSLFVDDLDYSHYRLLLKAGAAWQRDPLTLGLAMTTPSLGLGFLTSGRAYYNRTLTGQDLDGDGAPDDILAASSLGGIDTDYRSPLSIAVGASYSLPETSFHFTAEWFNAVPAYDVLDPSGLPEAVPGATLRRRLKQELQSTLNAGVGVEHTLKPDLEIYGGFATDFSAAVPGSEAGHSLAAWDIYHVSGGAAFRFGGLAVTGGIGYSFGSGPTRFSGDLTDVAGEDVLIKPVRTEVDYSRIEYIVAFDFTI